MCNASTRGSFCRCKGFNTSNWWKVEDIVRTMKVIFWWEKKLLSWFLQDAIGLNCVPCSLLGWTYCCIAKASLNEDKRCILFLLQILKTQLGIHKTSKLNQQSPDLGARGICLSGTVSVVTASTESHWKLRSSLVSHKRLWCFRLVDVKKTYSTTFLIF